MGILVFIIGIVVGVVAISSIKGKGESNQTSSVKRQLDEALTENEKLRKRNKEAERYNEDLLAEIEKLQRKSKGSQEDNEDLQDDLEDAQRKIKKITAENAELLRKINEYKIALETTGK